MVDQPGTTGAVPVAAARRRTAGGYLPGPGHAPHRRHRPRPRQGRASRGHQAAPAGVTRGALCHHYAGKQGLFRAVAEGLERELTEEYALGPLVGSGRARTG
ncbi:hypothetical protein [Amycolatopsis sp. CA-128772]|uniref:hypothetical protein n=1 Tax=Amycolatopsis sp. CA-128772 TaxID=2073159 RepID=UPI00351A8BA6